VQQREVINVDDQSWLQAKRKRPNMGEGFQVPTLSLGLAPVHLP
jgi:hypothetical protein